MPFGRPVLPADTEAAAVALVGDRRRRLGRYALRIPLPALEFVIGEQRNGGKSAVSWSDSCRHTHASPADEIAPSPRYRPRCRRSRSGQMRVDQRVVQPASPAAHITAWMCSLFSMSTATVAPVLSPIAEIVGQPVRPLLEVCKAHHGAGGWRMTAGFVDPPWSRICIRVDPRMSDVGASRVASRNASTSDDRISTAHRDQLAMPLGTGHR